MKPRAAVSFVLQPTPFGFCLRAGLLLLVLSLVGLTPWFAAWVDEPLILTNAYLTHKTLNALGFPTRLDGRFVYGQEAAGAGRAPFAMEVIPECTGVFALIVLTSLTVAFPVGRGWRLKGLVAGAALIFLLNWVRLVSLFILGTYVSTELFEEIHVFVWQGVFILVVAFYWYAWARLALRKS